LPLNGQSVVAVLIQRILTDHLRKSEILKASVTTATRLVTLHAIAEKKRDLDPTIVEEAETVV